MIVEELITCIYCNGSCYKNGFDRKHKQRYRCKEKRCRRSFTKTTKENLEKLNDKRVVLHLILAGCKISEITDNLNIKESTVKKWIHLHLKNVAKIAPPEPLISFDYLIRIYRGIEKKRISNLVRTPRKIKNRFN